MTHRISIGRSFCRFSSSSSVTVASASPPSRCSSSRRRSSPTMTPPSRTTTTSTATSTATCVCSTVWPVTNLELAHLSFDQSRAVEVAEGFASSAWNWKVAGLVPAASYQLFLNRLNQSLLYAPIHRFMQYFSCIIIIAISRTAVEAQQLGQDDTCQAFYLCLCSIC